MAMITYEHPDPDKPNFDGADEPHCVKLYASRGYHPAKAVKGNASAKPPATTGTGDATPTTKE